MGVPGPAYGGTTPLATLVWPGTELPAPAAPRCAIASEPYAFELSALSAPPWAPAALRLEVETNKSSPHGATLAPQRIADATADYGQLFAGNPFSSSNSWQTSMNGINYCGLFGSDASHLKSESGWNLLDLASKESTSPHNVGLQTAVRVNELPPQLHGLLWGPGTMRPSVSLVLKLSMWVAT